MNHFKFSNSPSLALPAATPSSIPLNAIVRRYLPRLHTADVPRKTATQNLRFNASYLNELEMGKRLPLRDMLAFADAAGLNDDERFELLNAGIRELDGFKGRFCYETLIQWAIDLCAPAGDAAELVGLWHESAGNLDGVHVPLLDNPRARVRAGRALTRFVHAEFRSKLREAANRQKLASDEPDSNASDA